MITSKLVQELDDVESLTTDHVVTLLQTDPKVRDQLLATLSDKKRTIVEKRVVEESASLGELKEQLGISKMAITKNRHEALRRLRALLMSDEYLRRLNESDPRDLSIVPVSALLFSKPSHLHFCSTLLDLSRMTEAEVLEQNHMGPDKLTELIQKMARFGAEFAPGPPALKDLIGKPELLERAIGELPLKLATQELLQKKGRTTIGDVVRCSADQLLEERDFGADSLRKVRAALGDLQLKLSGD